VEAAEAPELRVLQRQRVLREAADHPAKLALPVRRDNLVHQDHQQLREHPVAVLHPGHQVNPEHPEPRLQAAPPDLQQLQELPGPLVITVLPVLLVHRVYPATNTQRHPPIR